MTKILKHYACEFYPEAIWCKGRVKYPTKSREDYSYIGLVRLIEVDASCDAEAWQLVLKKLKDAGYSTDVLGHTWMPYCRNGRDGSKLVPPLNTSYWE